MPDQSLERPTTRGRRRPEIAEAMLTDDAADTDTSDYGADASNEQTYVGLAEGDTLVAKVAFNGQTDLGEAWFTLGATTRVFEGEGYEDAIDRLRDVVNGKVIELGGDLIDRIDELRAQQLEATQDHRITPRQG
ncbi:MAG TPA: hypothetical protein VIT65_23235 [Microlunatus sp.]